MATIGNVTIRIGANTNQLQSDLKRAERSIKSSAANMQALGERMTLSLSLPIAALGAASLKSAGNIQALQKGLTAVMGSSEAAAAEFEKLREVAKLPGLGLEEAARGSVALQSAGFSADEARRSLLAFGNALATVGKGKNELNFVNLAITQLQNKTGGFGQDLRQLTEQLPQLRGALTAAFGTADSEKIQELGVTGKEVVTAIITEFEKLPKVSGGLNNAFENLSDSIKVSLFQIGTAINEAFGVESILEEIGNKVQQLADWFSKLSPEVRKAIIVLAGVVAVLGPALIVFSQMYLAIGNIRLAWIGLSAAFAKGGIMALLNPVGLALAGIAVTAILVAKNWDAVLRALKDVANGFIELYNNNLLVRGAVQSILVNLKNTWEFAKLLFNVFLVGLKSTWNALKLVGGILVNILTLNLSGLKQSFKEFGKGVVNNIKELGGAFSFFGSNVLNNTKEGIEKTFDPTPIQKFKTQLGDISKLKGFENVLGGAAKKPSTPIRVLAPTGGTKTPAVTGGGEDKKVRTLSEQISDLKNNIDSLSIAYAQKPSAGILERLNEQIAKLKEKESVLEKANKLVDDLTTRQKVEVEGILQLGQFGKFVEILEDGSLQAKKTFLEIEKGAVNAKNSLLKNISDGLKVNYQETGFQTFFKSLENDLSNIQRQFDGGLISGIEKNAAQFDLLSGELKKLQKDGFGPLSPEVINVKSQLDKLGGFEGFSDMLTGLNKINGAMASISPVINEINGLFQSFTDKQIENIDARQQKEIEAINNSALSSEEKEKRITAIEDKAAKERRAIQRKQAIAAKLNGIFQATVSMLISVAKAAELGPIFGLPAAAVMKALGIANIAAIAAAPLPSLAIGTDYVKSDGMAYLHKGESVVPADVVGGGFTRNMQLFSVIRGNDIYMINERNQALAQRLK